MRLSLDAIREFKTIYRQEFGEDFPEAELNEVALRLVRFFRVLLAAREAEAESAVVTAGYSGRGGATACGSNGG